MTIVIGINIIIFNISYINKSTTFSYDHTNLFILFTKDHDKLFEKNLYECLCKYWKHSWYISFVTSFSAFIAGNVIILHAAISTTSNKRSIIKTFISMVTNSTFSTHVIATISTNLV